MIKLLYRQENQVIEIDECININCQNQYRHVKYAIYCMQNVSVYIKSVLKNEHAHKNNLININDISFIYK